MAVLAYWSTTAHNREHMRAAFLLVVGAARWSSGALIASSRLEQCFNDGIEALDCDERIVGPGGGAGRRGERERAWQSE